MGGMMGGAGMGAWLLLWIFLALALAVTGGVLVARALGPRHQSPPPLVTALDSPAVREAKDTLKMRYARGEISREEYLQGKVELED